MPPVNDNFTDRITLTGDSGTWSGSSDGATHETDEPAPFAGTGGASIWFQWTPGFTGQAQIDTIGSTYTGTTDRLDTVLDIFTGSTSASLSLVGGNDDAAGGGYGFNSRARVDVVAGTTYVIRVDGYGGDTGDVILHWLQYVPPPPPTVTGFTPSTANPGDTVTVTGTNFIDLDRVGVRFKFPFSGNEFLNVSFTIDSPTQLHFVVPTVDFGDVTGSLIVTGGAPDFVDVITPIGLIIPGTFGIVSVTPSSGPDGTEVTVTGTEFITSGIDFLRLLDPLVGGTASISFTIDSETQLRFTIPGGFSNGGPYRVQISHLADSDPDIDSSAAQTFTIGGPPSLSSVTPPAAVRGASAVVAGTNLTGTTAVTVNGTAAVYTVDSDVQVTVTVPAGAPLGAGLIVVTTPIGTASIGFEVLPPAPTISSFSPPSGSIGTTVTITGTGFDAAISVQVGATHVVFTIVNPTTITFVVPATAVSAPITVTTGGGSATTTDIFGINRLGSAVRLHLWKDRG